MVCKKDWVNFLIKKYFYDLFMKKEITVFLNTLLCFMQQIHLKSVIWFGFTLKQMGKNSTYESADAAAEALAEASAPAPDFGPRLPGPRPRPPW